MPGPCCFRWRFAAALRRYASRGGVCAERRTCARIDGFRASRRLLCITRNIILPLTTTLGGRFRFLLKVLCCEQQPAILFYSTVVLHFRLQCKRIVKCNAAFVALTVPFIFYRHLGFNSRHSRQQTSCGLPAETFLRLK